MKQDLLKELHRTIESITYTGSFLRADGILAKKFIDISSIPTVPRGIDICTEVLSELMEKLGTKKIATQSKSNNLYFATHISQKTGKGLIMVPPSDKISDKRIIGQYIPGEKITIFYPVAHISDLFREMILQLRKEGLVVETMIALIKINESIKEDLENIGIKLISVFEFNKNTGFKLKITEEYREITGA